MTTLKCNVIHCASNRDNRCCRPEIKVDGKQAHEAQATCCASFTPIATGATNTVDYSEPNPSMNVLCDAQNCVYNESGKCHADSINVTGMSAKEQRQTECGTFRCR